MAMSLVRVSSYLFLAILLHVALLCWFWSNLSISYHETLAFFNGTTPSAYLSRFGVYLFGQNDFGLRIFFLILHIFNIVLMFLYARSNLKNDKDSLFCTILFMLLPGINAGALLVLEVNITIFFTLLLCFLYQRYNKIPYWLLVFLMFLDESFSIIFLALIFYGISNKNTILIFVSLIGFGVNSYIFGIDIGGYPRGYFADTMGHLMLIFSPLIFVYFLYSLYRFANKKEKPLGFYIAIVALLFILFVSLRQKIDTQNYAPLLLCFLPFMVLLFLSGLRVRLPQFRARYKIPFVVSFIVLIIFTSSIFVSKLLFLVMPYSDNFALRHYIAKELSESLKIRGIYSVKTDVPLQERLRFYGIDRGDRELSYIKKENFRPVPIIYHNKEIVRFYVE